MSLISLSERIAKSTNLQDDFSEITFFQKKKPNQLYPSLLNKSPNYFNLINLRFTIRIVSATTQIYPWLLQQTNLCFLKTRHHRLGWKGKKKNDLSHKKTQPPETKTVH
ncbi:hypothetical protein TNCT_674571 [Trichonephila clavata]|uniref:Uncharacterized protein n=1 Tax=Trichonephila clavata TaxID=2740835 RepID=A0A8X6FCZ9_TRICU|nr:hypothetical protein TNCT_674571 [Trichonephila clavata]